MGFEDNRFECEVDEEFRCPICQDIIEDPIGSDCEHVFCKLCINQWLENESSCPVDRKALNQNQLCEPSRFFRNLYSKLMIKCEYSLNGCQMICKIENLKTHQNQCLFFQTKCENGCEGLIKQNEISSHNCIQYLKSINRGLNQESELNSEKVKDLQTMNIKLNQEISGLKLKLNNNSPKTSAAESTFFLEVPRNPRPKVSAEHKRLVESLKSNGVIQTLSVENVLLLVDSREFCYTNWDGTRTFRFNIKAHSTRAMILELLVDHLREDSKANVLNIGSNSGFSTICMAEMCGSGSKIIGIDRERELIEKSNRILRDEFHHLLRKVSFICKDWREGHKTDFKYDVILFSGAVYDVPQSIIAELNIGGRIIVPVGPQHKEQQMFTIDKLPNGSFKQTFQFNCRLNSLK